MKHHACMKAWDDTLTGQSSIDMMLWVCNQVSSDNLTFIDYIIKIMSY